MPQDQPKRWAYRGRLIEEDFDSPSYSGRVCKRRTGYVIVSGRTYKDGTTMYEPGSFATLAEARKEIDSILGDNSDG
jgi:hypothetical protein